MTPPEMHRAIRAELIARSEPWKLPIMQRFFKEPIDAYCTYTVHVRSIAKLHGPEFAAWSGQQRVELTAALWESGKFEEGAAAIQLFARMRRNCGYGEWQLFQEWLRRYVHNWAHCDALCADLMGLMLIAHPEWVAELAGWTRAKAVYQRRAALVAPLKGIRKGLFREEAQELLKLSAAAKEDILKKAIVWMRRELAR